MRMRPALRKFRIGAWLCALVVVPAAAITPAVAANMTNDLTTMWVPATAYGLTLIAAFSSIQH